MYVYSYEYVFMNVYVYVYMFVYLRVCMYVRMYVSTHKKKLYVLWSLRHYFTSIYYLIPSFGEAWKKGPAWNKWEM